MTTLHFEVPTLTSWEASLSEDERKWYAAVLLIVEEARMRARGKHCTFHYTIIPPDESRQPRSLKAAGHKLVKDFKLDTDLDGVHESFDKFAVHLNTINHGFLKVMVEFRKQCFRADEPVAVATVSVQVN